MGTPADTTDFTAIHTCMRRGGRALAIAVRTLDVSDRRQVDALRRYWEGYTGEVPSRFIYRATRRSHGRLADLAPGSARAEVLATPLQPTH